MNKLIKTCLCSILCSLPLSVFAQTTLAAWTFEGGYEQTSEDGGKILKLTPNGSDQADIPVTWFNNTSPKILPDECVGDKADYQLSALSTNRYWQICDGYNNKVLRIENAEANNITDYTDASTHNVYYEVKFPTTGYKNISVDYALASGNNTASPIEAVVSTDGGTTGFDAGSKSTASIWWTYDKNSVAISANNKPEVLVRHNRFRR